ncbi:MAG: spherulation-specific family 4 protein [Aquificaceae bacterium]|nr:spherulation-specific family 4 protein [Aquificaceae bacterium]MDW8423785.1 spherulation-specific family 4 protein [Aquificaceae bacterium]
MRYLLAVLIPFLLIGCGGGSGQGESPMANITTLIVPLYSYPVGSYEEEHRKLTQVQSSKELIFIANPRSGPGSQLDANYLQLIGTYKEKGFKVVGYVLTNYGNRNLQAVKEDMNRYVQFYPQVDGFFVDEVSNNPAYLSYYREIHQHARQLGKSLLIFNPGTVVPADYYSLADRIVVLEESSDFLFRNYRNYRANPKDCFLIYGVSSRSVAEEVLHFLRSRGAVCLYMVDENPPSWFRLSPYMDILLR